VASLSQGRTAAAQCGLFTYKSVPVIFEPPCNCWDFLHAWCGSMIMIFFRKNFTSLASRFYIKIHDKDKLFFFRVFAMLFHILRKYYAKMFMSFKVILPSVTS